MTGFDEGRDHWVQRLGMPRNAVRQEVIARQLAVHLAERVGESSPGTYSLEVLDVGAGQGTQAIGLAQLGHRVTAVEPDPAMRAILDEGLAGQDESTRRRVAVRDGTLGALADALGDAAYDVVLCHGVFMYLPAAQPAVTELAARVAPGGLLSLVVRNAAGLALRPALQGQWALLHDVLDEVEAARAEGRDPFYTNEIGVRARADDVTTLTEVCRAAGLTFVAHHGVRLVSDRAALDTAPPGAEEVAAQVAAELRLGDLDPYRRLATLAHLVFRRPHR